MKKIILLIICFFLCSCAFEEVFKNVAIDDFAPTSTKLTLTMTGDALVSPNIYKDAYTKGNYDFKKMFEPLISEIYSSDLLFYNQETVLTDQKLGFSGYPLFTTPQDFGMTMVNLGFNLVNRANNHTLDKGEAGVLTSCNFWNSFPSILTSGSVCTKEESETPKIMEMNGITYTLLSYTVTTDGKTAPNDYYVSIYSPERVKRDIEKVRAETDLVLVSMHWGEEYRTTPTDEQRSIAEYLASLGADIVIGTHPHIIEPVEWLGGTLVIYSLGNLISSQSTKNEYERRIGLLANVDIIKTTVDKKTKIELTNLNTELIYTYSTKDNREFSVIPFSKLNETVLNNYKSLKIKYDSIVKYYDNSIVTK